MAFADSNYHKFKSAVRLGPMSLSNNGEIGIEPRPMLDAGFSMGYGPFSAERSKIGGYSRDSVNANMDLGNNSSLNLNLSKDNFKNKGIQIGYRKDF